MDNEIIGDKNISLLNIQTAKTMITSIELMH